LTSIAIAFVYGLVVGFSFWLLAIILYPIYEEIKIQYHRYIHDNRKYYYYKLQKKIKKLEKKYRKKGFSFEFLPVYDGIGFIIKHDNKGQYIISDVFDTIKLSKHDIEDLMKYNRISKFGYSTRNEYMLVYKDGDKDG